MVVLFGTYDEKLNVRVVPALLIGQLGKNYTVGNDTLISGDESNINGKYLIQFLKKIK